MMGGLGKIPDYQMEHWRQASQQAPDTGAVLLYTGLTETRRLDWLQEPARLPYLLSPLIVYRPEWEQKRLFILPFGIEEESVRYTRELVTRLANQNSDITLMTRSIFSGPIWNRKASRMFEELGFKVSRREEYGKIELTVLQR